ncbi:MAG: PDZ domain-containing protein [Candidatus Omnitrophota bacterium]
MQYLKICIALISILLFTSSIYADTVLMKDSTLLKGLVIEEYDDRITLSTIDGEKDILRKNIREIKYDAKDQNYMQMGRLYDDRGLYTKSAFYYKEAMKLNPKNSEARLGYISSHTKLIRERDKMLKEELKRRDMILNWRKGDENITFSKTDKSELLMRSLGISIAERQGIFIIDSIKPYSTADKAGIKNGDILVAVWGKLVQHSKLEDVIDELIGPENSEVSIVVEKDLSVLLDNMDRDIYEYLGIALEHDYDGLMVKDIIDEAQSKKHGLKKGDFVIAIRDNITRYTPLKKIIKDINNTKGKSIDLTIRRKINLRREGGL